VRRPDVPLRLLNAPAVALVVAFSILPLLYVGYLSFQDMRVGMSGGFAGLDNYRFVLEDESVLKAFSNTLYFAALSVALAVLIGLGIALLLTLEFPARAIFRALVLLPLMVPPLVSGLLWRLMYDHELGVLSYFVRVLGGDPPVFLGNPDIALMAVSATEVWRATPFMVLVLLAALQSVPQELHEAAQLDGAGRWQRFRSVTLPAVRPVTSLVVLLSIITTGQIFTEPYLLTGGGPNGASMTPALLMYQKGIQQGQPDIAAAIGMILVIVVMIVSFISRRVTEGKNR
jgi:multiple sugar transport system permease protein